MRSAGGRTTVRRNTRYAVAAVVGVMVLASACGSSGTGNSGGHASTATSTTSTTGASTGTGGNTGSATTASVPATSPLAAALDSAYRSETAALATYRTVVSTLGPVGPFPNVIEAEQQHVSTLANLFAHYGLTPPASGTGQASPSTRSAACQLGVTIEQQIISLYNGQLPNVSSYPDVTTAFNNLKAASQDDHLPAFQRCA